MSTQVIRRTARERAILSASPYRVGLISNARSHRNRVGGFASAADVAGVAPGILYRSPRTLPQLARALQDFADFGVELIVVDGGDGTVRDIISCATAIFPGPLPRLAIVPSGKTNALALDLGIPHDWTVEQALRCAKEGGSKTRTPIEILRPGSTLPDLRGFLFGAGAFVRATALAQRTHKAGAFNGVAVGLSLVWGVAQTIFGGPGNPWRAGESATIRTQDCGEIQRDFYILFGTTLQRLPLGLKPFGRVRDGLKVLAIDAPPRRILRTLPALLSGSETPALEDAGYHRADPDRFDLTMESGFILDGELFAGGTFTVRRGTPLEFVAP